MVLRNSINNTSEPFTASSITATGIQATSLSFDSGTTTMSAYSLQTFTPSLSINGSTSGITYSSRSGTMIKIGKFGYIFMEMTLTSKGVSVGDVRIAMGVTTNSNANRFFPFIGQNISTIAGSNALVGEILSNDVFLYYGSNGGSNAPLENTNLTNDSTFNIAFSFVTS